ncbi:Protein of unknown function DUF4796 [Trinorchestia longiramus]|nr:Protein of unknown function DUF4796 [Trinorchestia longiramus]
MFAKVRTSHLQHKEDSMLATVKGTPPVPHKYPTSIPPVPHQYSTSTPPVPHQYTATMNHDPGLVCYRHCDAGVQIAQQLPRVCALCGALLGTAASLLDTPLSFMSITLRLFFMSITLRLSFMYITLRLFFISITLRLSFMSITLRLSFMPTTLTTLRLSFMPTTLTTLRLSFMPTTLTTLRLSFMPITLRLSFMPITLITLRLPCPLRRASQNPCCVAIKPTRGDFLHDYESGDDLHIGITDSEGCVYEFSVDGLQSECGDSFNGCVLVNVLEDNEDPVWQEYWNTALSTTIAAHDWSKESYDENERNCYSFVIEFLKTLQPPALKNFHLTKLSFCSSFVVPRASAAARYIAIYRAVKKDGCIALRSTDTPDLRPSTTNDRSSNGTRKEPEGRSSNSLNERVKSAEDRLQALSSNLHCKNYEKNVQNRSHYPQKSFITHRPTSNAGHETEHNSLHSQPESDPESDIENRVSKVIEDLLESQRIEQSRRYLTHYSDDIKKDLRSVVPPKLRNPKSFVALPHRFTPSQPDSSSESPAAVISNSGSNACTDKPRTLAPTPALSSKISKFTYKPCDGKPLHRDKSRTSNTQAPQSKPERKVSNSKSSGQAFGNTSNLVPFLDSRTETVSDITPVLKSRTSLSRESHGVPILFEAEAISLQVKCAVKNLSIEINDNIHGSHRPNTTVCTKNNHNNSTNRQENVISVKIGSEDVVNSSSVNNTVTYTDWVSDGAPAELTAGEFVSSVVPAVLTTSKWSSAVLSRRSSPENEMNLGELPPVRPSAHSHVQNNITNENHSNIFPLRRHSNSGRGLAEGSDDVKLSIDRPQLNIDRPQLSSAQRQSNACKQIVELCSKFEKPTFSSFGKGNPLPKARKPLRREQTWRYGQEPCPQNYEGKLMGKLDVNKGFDWETKGCPSTLSMPGYIYEDGVLPETRC